MKYSSNEIIKQVQQWLQTVVIDLNFCPFAKREADAGRIHYVVSTAEGLESALMDLLEACQQLDGDTALETTLLILPEGFADFEDYLDLYDLANQLLFEQGYEGVYQLASFHPRYCFDGVEYDDASNHTNRAPWPVLHILREASLERVLAHYPGPEKIPENNIARARELGNEWFEQCLKDTVI